MIILEGNELIGIYLLLRENELNLDKNQILVKQKIEKVLFESLSIEDLESIEKLYEKNVDVLEKKY